MITLPDLKSVKETDEQNTFFSLSHSLASSIFSRRAPHIAFPLTVRVTKKNYLGEKLSPTFSPSLSPFPVFISFAPLMMSIARYVAH